MEVVWSEEATRNYFRTIDYLLSEWNIQVALEFESRVNRLVENIQNFKEICPKSKQMPYHKCVIDSQNAMIYQVINSTLFIVTMIDNRSKHPYA